MILNYLKTHIFYLVLIAVGLVGFRGWLDEHDQRLMAQQAEKLAEQKEKSLEDQLAVIRTAQVRQVQVLTAQKARITTPALALPAVDAFDPALKPRQVNTLGPTAISVESVPLAQDLEQCKIDRVNLGYCEKELEVANDQVQNQKDLITSLKKKPAFWSRVKSTAQVVAVGVAIGVALGVAVH